MKKIIVITGLIFLSLVGYSQALHPKGVRISKTGDTITNAKVYGDTLKVTVGDKNYKSYALPRATFTDPIHANGGIRIGENGDTITKVKIINDSVYVFMYINGIADSIRINSDLSDTIFCDDYLAIYNSFLIKPNYNVAIRQDSLVRNLKSAGIWKKLLRLYVQTPSNKQASSVDWINPFFNKLVGYKNVIYDSTLGFHGNASYNSYMDMNYNPSLFGDGIWKTDAASIGAYINTNVSESDAFIVGNYHSSTPTTYPITYIKNTEKHWYGAVCNGSTGSTSFYTTGRNAGMPIFVRVNDTVVNAYFNGYLQKSDSSQTNGNNTLNDYLYLFADKIHNSRYSDNGIAALFVGGLLNNVEVYNLYNYLQNYLGYIGAAEEWSYDTIASFDFETDDNVGHGIWNTVKGSADFHNNTSPINGNYSALFTGDDASYLTTPSYGNEVEIRFSIKFTNATPSSNSVIFLLKQMIPSTQTMCYLSLYTNGIIHLFSGGASTHGETVLSDDTIYYFWVDYKKGTGSDAEAYLYISTTDTKPLTSECNITGSTATGTLQRLEFYNNSNLGDYYIDDLRVTSINPLAPTALNIKWENEYVKLNFKDNTAGIGETEIWRSVNGSNYELIQTLSPGVETYNDTSWINSTEQYKLRSICYNDTSEFSDIKTIVTPYLVLKVDESSMTTVNFDYIYVPPDTSLTLYWGDGDSTYITGGVGGDTISHTYATANSLYYITFEGAFSSLMWYTNNTSYSDLTKWNFPQTLKTLHLSNSNLTGGISGWNFPDDMTVLDIKSNNFYGDISKWTLPPTMHDFQVASNNFTGDLTNFYIPDIIDHFGLRDNNFTGDITNWTIPTNPVLCNIIYLSANSFTGDITNWSIPQKCVILHLNDVNDYNSNNNTITGDLSNWTAPDYYEPSNGSFNWDLSYYNLTGDLSNFIIPEGQSPEYFICRNTNFTKLPRGNFRWMKTFDFRGNNCNQSEIDSFLIYVDNYFTGSVVPLVDCTYYLNGDGMAAPSVVGINAKESIENKYTLAGYVATIYIN